METDPAALAVREALFLTLQLAGPPLLVMLAIGLVVSLLQALTQIQEATLAFLPKVVALGVVLLLLGPSMVGYMRGFAGQLFDRMVTAGRIAP